MGANKPSKQKQTQNVTKQCMIDRNSQRWRCPKIVYVKYTLSVRFGGQFCKSMDTPYNTQRSVWVSAVVHPKKTTSRPNMHPKRSSRHFENVRMSDFPRGWERVKNILFIINATKIESSAMCLLLLLSENSHHHRWWLRVENNSDSLDSKQKHTLWTSFFVVGAPEIFVLTLQNTPRYRGHHQFDIVTWSGPGDRSWPRVWVYWVKHLAEFEYLIGSGYPEYRTVRFEPSCELEPVTRYCS